MCGIAGHIGTNERYRLRSLDKLSHRGPDAQSIESFAGGEFGHVRLSIIDLDSRANQPFYSANEHYLIVFNGEIYNYRELQSQFLSGVKLRTTSDTEVLVELWNVLGAECVQHLRGMFAFAVYDMHDKTLTVVRDRLGQKPLFFAVENNQFLFASEVRQLADMMPRKPELDARSIDLFFAHQFIPGPYSVYTGIEKLLPGHIAVWDGSSVRTKQYWEYTPKREKLKVSEAEAIELVDAKIRESVKYRLVSDVPVGTMLSAGVDSGVVTAIAAQQSDQTLQTFTIGFQERAFDESVPAQRIADLYGTEHHNVKIQAHEVQNYILTAAKQYGEPYGDSSALPSFIVSQLAAMHVKVALNGDGGDELFGGYRRISPTALQKVMNPVAIPCYQVYNKLEALLQLPFSAGSLARKAIAKGRIYYADPLARSLFFYAYFNRSDMKELYTEDFYREVQGVREAYDAQLLEGLSTQVPLLDKLLQLEYRGRLPGDLLVKMDIASMTYGLEARSPFLDHELVELSTQLHPTFKQRGGVQKYILKQIAKKYLPQDHIDRRKTGFAIPVEEWMKGSVGDLLKDVLAGTPEVWKYLHKKHINALISRHQKGEIRVGAKLWLVLNFAIFMQEYQT